MKKRTRASRRRAWGLLVVASIALFQLQLMMAPTASASAACNGAFSGSPSGTLALSSTVPNGGSISAGQPITITATWDTNDWNSLDAYYNCFQLNGSSVASLEFEEKPPTNDGIIVQTFNVPDAVSDGDELCVRNRLSGEPRSGNTSTQKGNRICWTVGNQPPPRPDVKITKSASTTTVNVDGSVTFTLAVENIGGSTANNVVITDTIPAGLDITGTSNNHGTCTTNHQTVTCGVGDLNAGATKSVTITVRAMAGACPSVNNSATVSADNDSGTAGNNTSNTVTINVTCPNADVQITKSSGAPAAGVAPGDSFTYTITVTNAGGTDATGVEIQDTIPADLTITDHPSNCSVSGQSVTCDLGIVAAGATESVSITVEATADACPLVTNRATVTATNEPAANTGNNTSNDVTTLVNCEPPPPPEPGVSVRIVKSNDADRDGDYSGNEEARRPDVDVPFLLVITNNGEDAWTITDLTDSFDGHTIDLLKDKCSDLKGVTLQPGESATCNFTLNSYSPPADDPKDNTAEICVENMTGSKTDCDNDDSRVRSAEVLGRTTAPTKTPPGGTAFTGSQGTLGFGAIALGLLLLGSGLVWVGYRRRQQYEG
ncbi:MAG: DUF11 domain-containing protein [Actinomycetota bacterium]